MAQAAWYEDLRLAFAPRCGRFVNDHGRGHARPKTSCALWVRLEAVDSTRQRRQLSGVAAVIPADIDGRSARVNQKREQVILRLLIVAPDLPNCAPRTVAQAHVPSRFPENCHDLSARLASSNR